MKAAFIEAAGPIENIKYGELPRPQPKEGEVVIRLKYSSLNHLDLWIRKGIPGHSLGFPHVLGADGSGVLEETGEEVIVNPAVSCMACFHCREGLEKNCKEYQILGENRWGTNAEFIAVPRSSVFAKPKELSFQEAAAFPLVTITAWEMLVGKAGLKEGQSVLIHGAGSGVSQMAIQIAKLFKARVITTSTSEEKLSLAHDLGADICINTKRDDFLKVVRKDHPLGVDIIVDHVGEVFWEKNIRLLTGGGALVTCGATSGYDAKTDLRHVFFRQLRILGSTMGNKRDFLQIIELMKKRKLRAVIDEEFALSQLADAHRRLQAGKQNGKVLLKIS